MSYIKTTWVDNVTPIDKDNLNKIEQGIYDNSLVADAVNNVVKPNDEAYKDAEITEGQITDVLAVNDVLIKGNTLQDGEPTPDSPVDVNVVSGSNVISTSNKNLFNKKNYSYGYVLSGNAQYTSNNFGTYIKCKPNTTYTVSKILTSRFRLATSEELPTQNNHVECSSIISNERLTHLTITSRSNDNYLIINYHDGGSSYNIDDIVNSLQVEENSTATELVEHQGKELPLDLPVENLFNPTLNSQTLSSGTIITKNSDNSYTMSNGSSTADLIVLGTINVKEGEVYYLSDQRIGGANNISLRRGGSVLVTTETNSIVEYTSTATETLNVYARYQSTSDLIYKPMISTEYSKTYTPYGTTPIELCKVGDYQDYFYRDNGKWYLHKEIGKVVLNGTENDWSYPSDNRFNLDNFSARYRKELGHITYFSDNYVGYNQTQSNGDFNALVQNVDYGFNLSTYPIGYTARFKDTRFTTVADFKTWLVSNNVLLYYVLETATDTEITDTTLINQLEAIYNAPLYEQTNITQTNNDLPIVLDITACKDNINGIKAWIRK